MKFRLLTILVICCCPFDSMAEDLVRPGSPEWRELFDPPYTEPTEIPANAPLRQELFDQLRPRIERIAERAVRFQGSLRAFKNWALFVGRTLNIDGKSIKMPPMDNDDTAALWLRTHDGWRLVDFSGGHSDAFFVIWPEVFGVPRSLVEFRGSPQPP